MESQAIKAPGQGELVTGSFSLDEIHDKLWDFGASNYNEAI
jgi:hypothetical protein